MLQKVVEQIVYSKANAVSLVGCFEVVVIRFFGFFAFGIQDFVSKTRVVGRVVFEHKFDGNIGKNDCSDAQSEICPLLHFACVVRIAAFLKSDALMINAVKIYILELVKMYVAHEIHGDKIKIAEVSAGSWHLKINACT